ncbi:hypothetical protein [Clostridium faecium]
MTELLEKLSFIEKKINFNNICKLSRVSKKFLYKNEEIKKKSKKLRNKRIDKITSQRNKYDKSAKVKDIIIIAKNKKVEKL